jgi:nucleotide-binding universal stress UspA family protein
MGKPRRSYEAGHRPKFLVVADGTPEASRALRYAARRVARVGATLAVLTVVPPQDAPLILGVVSLMEADATQEAADLLEAAAGYVRSLTGIEPDRMLRHGQLTQEVLKAVEEDEDISALILAMGTGKEGPGPLVSLLTGKWSTSFPVPVALVPGHLQDIEIDALA